MFVDNKCSVSQPTHEVGIIQGGTKDKFSNNMRYYDNMIYTEQRIKFLNPVPSTDFKVFANMKKQVVSSNNFTTTGYLTLPELRIGKPDQR